MPKKLTNEETLLLGNFLIVLTDLRMAHFMRNFDMGAAITELEIRNAEREARNLEQKSIPSIIASMIQS